MNTVKIAHSKSLPAGSLFHKKSTDGKTFVVLYAYGEGDYDNVIGYAEWTGGPDPVGPHRTMTPNTVLLIDVPPVLVDGDYGQITSGHASVTGDRRQYIRAASN